MRVALVVLFALLGLLLSSWMGRMPSVLDELGGTAVDVGTVMTANAVGKLIGVLMMGQLVPRIGTRRTMLIGLVGNLAGFSIAGAGVAAGSVVLFGVGMALNGLVVAGWLMPVNIEAAGVERALGRAVLPLVHAAVPVGALLGTGLASATSALGISAAGHIVGVAVAVTLARVWLVRPATALGTVPARTARAERGGSERAGRHHYGARRAWTDRRALRLGLIILAVTALDGGAGNWISLAVVDSFGTAETVGIVAFSTFTVAMLVTRLAGASLMARFDRVLLLRVSAVVCVAGLLLFGLAPALPLVWGGIVLWGVGASLAAPIALGAASDDPLKAPARLSVTSTFASVAAMSVPPALGLLADAWNPRIAMTSLVVLATLGFFAATAARPER